jgi:oxaloacetate decarboxylase (Na+ extruding) subunit alpha
LKAAVGVIPLEFHSHCTIALAQFSYLDAAQRGAQTFHIAAAAAANGTSQPAALTTLRNLRDLGLAVDVDDKALQEMDAYFTALASAEGLSYGQPQEFDRSYFRHQMPGG